MFGMYFGRYENKIDAKGRLSIPADFRRLLEAGDPNFAPGRNAQMAIVFGDHRRNYLEVYSIKGLWDVHQQIQAMDKGLKKRADLQRLFAHQIQPATFDETGRIVLNAFLRNKIGLKDRALVLGDSDTFVIWEPDAYERDALDGYAAEDDYDPERDPAMYLQGKTFAPSTQ